MPPRELLTASSLFFFFALVLIYVVTPFYLLSDLTPVMVDGLDTNDEAEKRNRYTYYRHIPLRREVGLRMAWLPITSRPDR